MVESVNSFNTSNATGGIGQSLTRSFSEKLRNKFPGKIPVIVSLDKYMLTDYEMSREKFLVDGNVTVSSFQYTLRKYIMNKKTVSSKVMDSSVSIFVFYGDPQTIPRASDTIGDLYTQHSSNGFLFATVLKESTFG